MFNPPCREIREVIHDFDHLDIASWFEETLDTETNADTREIRFYQQWQEFNPISRSFQNRIIFGLTAGHDFKYQIQNLAKSITRLIAYPAPFEIRGKSEILWKFFEAIEILTEHWTRA